MESNQPGHAADPIFSDVDPVYRGVDIPLRYFKLAVLHRVRGPSDRFHYHPH